MGEHGAEAVDAKQYGRQSKLGSSRCLGMGLWPRQISSEHSSFFGTRNKLAEPKRQVVIMKPAVEEQRVRVPWEPMCS